MLSAVFFIAYFLWSTRLLTYGEFCSDPAHRKANLARSGRGRPGWSSHRYDGGRRIAFTLILLISLSAERRSKTSESAVAKGGAISDISGNSCPGIVACRNNIVRSVIRSRLDVSLRIRSIAALSVASGDCRNAADKRWCSRTSLNVWGACGS